MDDCGSFNGSTARYIYYLLELIELFGSLDGLRIIEIGGGYGGQCKIINDAFTPKEYMLVDLPNVLELQERFLTKFGLESIAFSTMAALPDMAAYDLVLSNYAFCECTRKVQEVYLAKVLRVAKRGYLKINSISNPICRDNYQKRDLLRVLRGSRALPHIPRHAGCSTVVWDKPGIRGASDYPLRADLFDIRNRWLWHLSRLWV